jgi:hypothetical protein
VISIRRVAIRRQRSPLLSASSARSGVLAHEFDLPLRRAGGKAAARDIDLHNLETKAPAGDPPLIARGGARFWRVSFALFLGSFATFALL